MKQKPSLLSSVCVESLFWTLTTCILKLLPNPTPPHSFSSCKGKCWSLTFCLWAVLLSSPSRWLQEEDDENLYTSIQRLRDRTSELSTQVSLLERSGSADLGYQQSLEELRAAQDQLSELVEARNRRWLILQHREDRDKKHVVTDLCRKIFKIVLTMTWNISWF